jgi:hypothetical protein
MNAHPMISGGRSPPTQTIPISRLAPGLYLIMQTCANKGFHHYAILDVGNRLGYQDGPTRGPVIVHQTPPHPRRELANGTGVWKIVMKIADERHAWERLNEACTNPQYDALINNCEHFAKYVATGTRESRQVQVVGFVAAFVVLVLAAA